MAYHVMLLDLKDRSLLSDGKRFAMTLHFEKKPGMSRSTLRCRKKAPDGTKTHMHAQ
nr:hypothetical protein GCM10020185_23330 [Pseudomonas brassicacearum subsp. brassicacearum]